MPSVLIVSVLISSLLAGLFLVQRQQIEQQARSADASRLAGYVIRMRNALVAREFTFANYDVGPSSSSNPISVKNPLFTDYFKFTTDGTQGDSNGLNFRMLNAANNIFPEYEGRWFLSPFRTNDGYVMKQRSFNDFVNFFNADLLPVPTSSLLDSEACDPTKGGPQTTNASGEVLPLISTQLLGCVQEKDFTFFHQNMKLHYVRVHYNKVYDFSENYTSFTAQPTELMLHFTGLHRGNILEYLDMVTEVKHALSKEFGEDSVNAYFAAEEKGVSTDLTDYCLLNCNADAVSADTRLMEFSYKNYSEKAVSMELLLPEVDAKDIQRVNQGVAFKINLMQSAPLTQSGAARIEDGRDLSSDSQEQSKFCWTFGSGANIKDQCVKLVETVTNDLTDPEIKPYGLGVEGTITYQSKATNESGGQEKVQRTPLEVSYESFQPSEDSLQTNNLDYKDNIERGDPVKVNQITCPGGFTPKIAVATSSFSNSGVGDLKLKKEGDLTNPKISSDIHHADIMSGIIYRWKEVGNQWEITGTIGSPSPSQGTDSSGNRYNNQDCMHHYVDMSGSAAVSCAFPFESYQNLVINPPSVSFVVSQWCEK